MAIAPFDQINSMASQLPFYTRMTTNNASKENHRESVNSSGLLLQPFNSPMLGNPRLITRILSFFF
jgi:hypothetical protein